MFQIKVVEKIITHILCSITFCEKNMIEPHSTSDYLKRSMRIASWISKATNTRSEFLTTSILLQQRFNEPTSMLLYTYVARLFIFVTGIS
jgi:hypothetical protein